MFRIYNNAIPPTMLIATASTTPNTLKSKEGALPPSLFFVAVELDVSVTVPLPAVAVPVLSVSAFPEF
jgi:hypothetical protein